MSYHPRYCTILYGISCLLDAVDGQAARALGQTSKFGAVLDMVTDRCATVPVHTVLHISCIAPRCRPNCIRGSCVELYAFLGRYRGCGARVLIEISKYRCTTSCLLCYLSSAYPSYALLFQFLIALDFSSHYMHMYRCVQPTLSCGLSPSLALPFTHRFVADTQHQFPRHGIEEPQARD